MILVPDPKNEDAQTSLTPVYFRSKTFYAMDRQLKFNSFGRVNTEFTGIERWNLLVPTELC